MGTARTWRWAAAAVTAIVAISATVAQQHITATAVDDGPVVEWVNTVVTATSVDPVIRSQPTTSTTTDSLAGPRSFRGIIRPRDVATLTLPTAALVKDVLVSVGDRVEGGEPLVVLDRQEPDGVLAQMRFEADLARNHANELESAVKAFDASIAAWTAETAAQPEGISVPRDVSGAIARAQTAYEEAVAREQRAAALQAHGVSAREELEQAQVAVRAASDNLRLLRRESEATAKLAAAQTLQSRTQAGLVLGEQQRQRQERASELAQARLRQRETEAALARTKTQYGDLTLRAPGRGLVAELGIRTGDRSTAGAPIVKLATMDPMIVDVKVPSTVVNTIARGDPVVVRLPEAGQEYSGRIRTIAPLPGRGGDHPVEVEFANPSSTLLAGRAADVRFSPDH